VRAKFERKADLSGAILVFEISKVFRRFAQYSVCSDGP